MNPLRCFDPTHRSYSGDRLWDECQWKAHAERDLDVQRSFPAKVARGSTVDELCMALIEGSDVPDVTATFKRYAAEYNVPSWDDKDIEAAAAQVDLFTRDVLPTLAPVWATQHEGHFDLDGTTYHYHTDIVYQDGSIDDLKAPDQRLGIDRAATDPQLTAYAYGLWAEFGHESPRVGLIGLVNSNEPDDVQPVRSQKRKPWLDRQSSSRSRVQLDAWADDARRREAGRRWAETTGVYQTQARLSPYGCNGCSAKALCPSWAGWGITTATKEAVA